MGSSIALGPRHYFICVPSLLILGAQGMVWLFNKGKEYALATSLTLVFLTIQAAIIYVPSVISDLKSSYLSVDSKVTRISERETLKPALVFIRSDIKGYYNSQSGFLANSPWLDDKIIYAQELDSEQNQRVIAAYPNRYPYVFICPNLDEPGMLYPFKDAPTPKPGDVTLFYTLSSSKNPGYLLK